MKTMGEAKEFFQQIRDIDRQIDQKIENLGRMQSLAEKCTATIKEVSVFGGGGSRSMEDTIAKIITLQSEINADIDRLVDMKQKAILIINQIRNTKQRMVMEGRYLNGKTFEALSCDLDCSFQWIHELHKRALRTCEKIMANNSDS